MVLFRSHHLFRSREDQIEDEDDDEDEYELAGNPLSSFFIRMLITYRFPLPAL
jgi:hypothetical protein